MGKNQRKRRRRGPQGPRETNQTAANASPPGPGLVDLIVQAVDQGDWGAVQAALGGLATLESEEQTKLELIARQFMSQRDFDKAALVYEKLVACLPLDARLRNALSVSLIMGGWVNEGLAQIEQAVRLVADSPLYMGNLIKALLLLGKWEEATAWLERLKPLAPEGSLSDLETIILGGRPTPEAPPINAAL